MAEFPDEMQAIKAKLDAKPKISGNSENLAFIELWDAWGYKR